MPNTQQAGGGFIAVYTNENGNCSIAGIAFETADQATGWARKALRDDNAKKVRVEGMEVIGEYPGGMLGTSEVRYTVYEMGMAKAGVAGSKLGEVRLHTIR